MPKQRPEEEPEGKLVNVTYKSLDGEAYATVFFQQGLTVYVADYRHIGSGRAIEEAKAFREGFAASQGISLSS